MTFSLKRKENPLTDQTVPCPPYRLITTPAALRQAAPELMKASAAGVDVEADSMFHFTEHVCLIQIAVPEACLLIDPLAVTDLSCLQPFFLDPAITKIFHGASYDVRCLSKDFNIRVNNLYDSEIACRFLGLRETGLNAVVQSMFQETLDKKYQKKDWSQRPLSGGMLEYAARDVLYLIPLWKILTEQVERKRRTAWVAEECRLISLARYAEENGDPLFMKIKGAGRLDRRSLAVLEELLKKRRDIAGKKDLPPFKVMGNTVLMMLAEEKPSSREALRRTGILSAKQESMYGEPVCRAIQTALETGDTDLPVYPREKRAPLSRKASLRVDALKRWREITAEALAMDAGLILPNALAVGIARDNPRTVEELDRIDGMKEWQKQAFGRDVVAILNNNEGK